MPSIFVRTRHGRPPVRLPLAKWTFIRRFVAGSIALFLLLLTHQLVWSAFSNLTFKLSGRTLWMFAEDLAGNRPSLVPSNGAAPPVATSDSQVAIRVVAPADRIVDVRQNNAPLHFQRQATGGSTTRVDLRKGLNTFLATSRKNGEQYPSDRAELFIVYHPLQPAAPWILGGAINSAFAQVVGFGEPDSTVTIDTRYSLPVIVDRAGSFSAILSSDIGNSRPPEAFTLRLRGPNGPSLYQPNGVQLDPAQHGFQFASPNRTLSRQLHIQIGPDSFKLSFKASIPVDTDLFEAASRSHDAARLLRDAVGVCLMGAHDASLSWLSCYPGSDDSPLLPPFLWAVGGAIDVQFEHAPGPYPIELAFQPVTAIARLFPTLPGDELRVETDPALPLSVAAPGCRHDGNVVVCGPGPESGSLPLAFGQILLAGRQTPQPMPVETGPSPYTQSPAGPSNPQGNRPLDRLYQLEAMFGENIRGMFRQLLAAIPFLVLLWILRHYPLPKPAHTRTIRAVTLTFLTLHLSFLALSLFNVFLGPRSIAFIHDLGGQTFEDLSRVLQSATYIQPFAVIGMVLLIGPLFQAFRRRSPAQPPSILRVLLRGVAWLLFWAIAAAAPAAVIWARIRTDNAPLLVSIPVLAAVLVGGLLVLWFVLFWLLRTMFRIPIDVRDAVPASWGMLILPLIPLIADALNGTFRHGIATWAGIYPYVLPERASPYVSSLLVAVLGAVLLFHTGKLTLRLTNHTGAWRWVRSRNPLLLLLPLFVVSLPVGNSPFETNVFTVTSLFSFVGWFLPYAIVIGALVYVRDSNPEGLFQLTTGEIATGALVFAWYVSGHGASILFIPVPFLIAWYIFRYWLIVPEQPAAQPVTGSVLSRFINERRARSRVEDLQKGLDKKFSQGDLEFSVYKTRLDEAEHDAKYAAAALLNEAGTLTPRVFARGAEPDPWSNAAVAVRYGSIIAVPFMVLTLVRILQNSTNSLFPLVDLIYALVFSVTSWLLIAALFGYFYHLIRGRNGFEKALAFSLAVVLPSIPLRLIAGELPVDSAQLLDMVEVMAFVLVLALTAFDWRVLQKYRHGWRELFTVYGLASAAYGSTIALAVASSLGGKELLPTIWKFLQGLAGPVSG